MWRHQDEAIGRAHAEGVGTRAAEKALAGYPVRLSHEWGGYFRLGQGFVKADRAARSDADLRPLRPAAAHLDAIYHQVVGSTYDTREGDWMDRVIHSLSRVVPSA